MKKLSDNASLQFILTLILHLNLKRVKIASNDMEYLDKVLGVKVTYDDVEIQSTKIVHAKHCR